MTGRGGYGEMHRHGQGCHEAVVTLGWRLNRAGKREGVARGALEAMGRAVRSQASVAWNGVSRM